MCTEPKCLFATPVQWLDEKQDRGGREEHSTLFHVIKTAVTYLHALAAPDLPTYRSLLSSRGLCSGTGAATGCTLPADSVPRVVLQKHLKS